MKSRVLLFSFFLSLLFGQVQAQKDPIPKVSFGTIERIENFDSKYVDARHVDVWLPEDYDPNKSYPVLYMHDGQALYDANVTWNKQEWGVDETISQLLKEGKIKACIVVGAWNGGPSRHADYFPQKPFKALSKSYRDYLINELKRGEEQTLFSTKVQSDRYLKFLVKELKPYIDANYATKPEREHTFVAGSSMGGLISWYAICEYPKVFAGAACLSTHWPGIFTVENNPIPAQFLRYLDKKVGKLQNHKIYFDYGTETLDALYEPFQLQADEIMRKKGFDESNWKTMKFTGANHSEDAWRDRLHIPLTFLLN